MLCCPATLTYTSASPARSTDARSRTSSPAAAASPPRHRVLRPPAATADGEFTLVTAPIVEFGYLTATVDMSGTGTLSINYKSTAGAPAHDTVTVDLATSKMGPAASPGVPVA